MRQSIFIAGIFILLTTLYFKTAAQSQHPDTVKVGIYVTGIHDIDFKAKEYTVSFWLWLKYKNKKFDFMQNLEVPQAKSVNRTFAVVDSSQEMQYMQMKLQCVMKDNWKIGDFPFDRQTLRLSLENSQFDSRSLIFVPDTVGKHYDPRFVLNGWNIDSCLITSGIKNYETGFGDETLAKPHTEYSSFKVKLLVDRDAGGLFWKMFLGMYIAFFIAYVCFYIHEDSMDSRFALSVGALFAVIGNKYIIDSSLPESTSFTLVDTLHGITLFFVLLIVSATAYTLKLVKKDQLKKARRFDFIFGQILLVLYVILNIYFIVKAKHGG